MGYVLTALISVIFGAAAYKLTDIVLWKLRQEPKATSVKGDLWRASMRVAFVAAAMMACIAVSTTLIWHWFSGESLVYCAVLPLAAWLLLALPVGLLVAMTANKQIKAGIRTTG